MKTYKDYENEYYKAISNANENDVVAKKDVWISSKWQTEVDFMPNQPNCISLLQDLQERDNLLYLSVINGLIDMLEVFENLQKNKNDLSGVFEK